MIFYLRSTNGVVKKAVTPKAIEKRAAKKVTNVVEKAEMTADKIVVMPEIMITGFLPILLKEKEIYFMILIKYNKNNKDVLHF